MTVDIFSMLGADLSWQEHAECARSSSDMWFPEVSLWEREDGEGGNTASARRQAEEAKRVCNTLCTVRDECAALANELRVKDGIWGGVDRGTQDNRDATHCPKNHPYDEVNTRWSKSGRKCRACDRENVRTRRNAA